ncbi:MAG: rhamnulokinase [Opitutales bacterium]|nr:rhamnulokinase [Opitutales bacterium]
MRKVYLAADCGAGSGRVIAGIFENGTITLEEICRFDNQPVDLNDSLHWGITRIFGEIKSGIGMAVAKYGKDVVSIGVDTWGVDYGLLDEHDRLLGIPYCYRDARTDGMIDHADSILSQPGRYEHAGLQLLHFNTLYQLLAEKRLSSSQLDRAESLLFIPDIINFWLSGVLANEATIASTSELLDAKSGQWSEELIDAYGLPKQIFKKPVEPGEILGPVKSSICVELGIDFEINVVATPSHDTAAAVAACPLESANSVYISSGTWSLMGIEAEEAFTTETANAMKLTNERGVEGTTRLLKNISGFWIFQQAKRDWDLCGLGLGYDELRELAVKAEPFQAFLNPNDPCFEKPGGMVSRIMDYFERTGQSVPEDPGVICRSVFEGLALSYRKVLKGIERVTGEKYDTLNIIGGGSQNPFLNQLAADATGCKVIAGPIEGSGLGNILAQLKADGEIGSIRSGRSIIEQSFELKAYEPGDSEVWDKASERFDALLF